MGRDLRNVGLPCWRRQRSEGLYSAYSRSRRTQVIEPGSGRLSCSFPVIASCARHGRPPRRATNTGGSLLVSSLQSKCCRTTSCCDRAVLALALATASPQHRETWRPRKKEARASSVEPTALSEDNKYLISTASLVSSSTQSGSDALRSRASRKSCIFLWYSL